MPDDSIITITFRGGPAFVSNLQSMLIGIVNEKPEDAPSCVIARRLLARRLLAADITVEPER